MTKRARFAMFAISIVDNLFLLHQQMDTIKVRLPRCIINVPCGLNFMTILDFFISRRKHWPLSRGYFGSWGHTLVAFAVVERFKQELVVVFILELK